MVKETWCLPLYIKVGTILMIDALLMQVSISRHFNDDDH